MDSAKYLCNWKIMLLDDQILDSLHDKVAGLLHQLAEHRDGLRRRHSLAL